MGCVCALVRSTRLQNAEVLDANLDAVGSDFGRRAKPTFAINRLLRGRSAESVISLAHGLGPGASSSLRHVACGMWHVAKISKGLKPRRRTPCLGMTVRVLNDLTGR
jgi:hypothetical protein